MKPIFDKLNNVNKKSRIIPCHTQLAIRNDDEMRVNYLVTLQLLRVVSCLTFTKVYYPSRLKKVKLVNNIRSFIFILTKVNLTLFIVIGEKNVPQHSKVIKE
jgi:hypothetical protein